MSLEISKIGNISFNQKNCSLFNNISEEIISLIFYSLSHKDLLNFEMACLTHPGLTPSAWYELRKKDFFLYPEWKICQNNHKDNYTLSKAVVSYVGNLANATTTQELEKFALIRQKFPPFKALIQLTQLPKEQEIPEELAEKLKKEELIQIISHLYQIARSSQLEDGEKAVQSFQLLLPKLQELTKQSVHLRNLVDNIVQSSGVFNQSFFKSLLSNYYSQFEYYFSLEGWKEATETLKKIVATGGFSLKKAIDMLRRIKDPHNLEALCHREWICLAQGGPIQYDLKHLEPLYDILIREYDRALTSKKAKSAFLSSEIQRLFLAAIETKMRLGDFEGADQYIHIFFGHMPELVFSHKIKDWPLSEDQVLLHACLIVKKKIKDQAGMKWFLTLLNLTDLKDSHLTHLESCQTMDKLLDENFCQSKAYQIPLSLLLKLAQIKIRLGKPQEAEIFYDACIANYSAHLKLDDYAKIALFKSNLGKWKESADILHVNMI